MLVNLFKPLDQVLLTLLSWLSAGCLEEQSMEMLTSPSPKPKIKNIL